MIGPRVVSGPTLLTGICFCAACGGAMTLRTGKSGRYKYYTCCTKARQGETACKGRTVPMEKLDSLVAEHIEQRLLQPKRLRTESGGYRRDHLRALAQRVEVDAKEVWIIGSKSVLLRTLVAASSAKTAGQFCTEVARPKRFELLTPRFVVCTKRLILLMYVPIRRNCVRELRRINPVPRIYFPSARLRWAPTYWSRG
jgi:hypothetical protein